MAEHYHWSNVALDYVDEKTASWFHDTFGKMLDQQIVTQAEYVSRLGKIILLVALSRLGDRTTSCRRPS